MSGAGRPWSMAQPASFVFTGDRPYAVLAFTVRNERIVEIDILADPERLARLDFSVLDA